MSTYCISDIHGHLIEFKELLKKIKFSKEDRLYLLGDYVDQGEESMQLILYIIELQNQGYNIKCLMGNHDLMMLRCLVKSYKNSNKTILVSGNWETNGGAVTLADWNLLSAIEKETIYNWLKSLDFVVEDLVVGDKHFYLSHAYPIFNSSHILLGEYKSKEDKAVWYRMEKEEDPFFLYNNTEDKILIHGHTPTNHYLNSVPLRIYSNIKRHKICIDCGGKALTSYGCEEIARLGALRLDDMEEFYISSRNKK